MRTYDDAIAEPTVKTRVTQYVVNAHPDPESLDGSIFDLTVEYRGNDLWAVCRHGRCLDASGRWSPEPRPGERDDEMWLAMHRFPERAALDLAAQWAPFLKVNGHTPREAWAELNGAKP